MAQTCIVIGAGLVGAACAYRLQAAGWSVSVVDPGDERAGASFGNAGHIAAEQVEPLASHATLRKAPSMLYSLGGPLDFRLGDLPAWAPWALRYVAAARPASFESGTAALSGLMSRAVGAWVDLLNEIGASDLIRTDGHVVLWFSPQEAERGARVWSTANIGTATTRLMNQAELAPYRALMSKRPPVAGLRFQGTARLATPAGARRAILGAFERAGGRMVRGRVERIGSEGAVDVGGERLHGDRLVVTAGVRSRGLMACLGVTTPLIAERGYSIQFDAPAWPADLSTAVLEGQSIVLAPHAEGLRATSYVEFARPDSPPDVGKWTRLERRIRQSGLPVPEQPQRWIGSRPTLPDYVPAIGRLDDRVLYAFGHQHLGVTLSAVTAEHVVDLAAGGAVDARFDIRRFGH